MFRGEANRGQATAAQGDEMAEIDRDSDEFQTALEEAVKERIEDETEGLVSKNKELLGKLRKANRTAKQYDDIDPEKYRELLAASEKAETEKAKAEGDWETMREKLEARHATALKSLEERLGQYETALRSHLVSDSLQAAIANAGVLEEFRPAVLALLRDKGPQMVEEEGQFKAVFTDDVGDPIPLKDYVAGWAKTDAAAPFLPGAGTGGSGREPGTGAASGRRGGVKTIPNDPELIGRHAQEISEGKIQVDMTTPA